METQIIIFIAFCLIATVFFIIAIRRENKKIKAIQKRTAEVKKETERLERETELMKEFIKEIGGNEKVFDELNQILENNKIQH